MTVNYYSDLRQRDDLITTANLGGESMIHDDFVDINGNPTDGKSGRLTFGVKVTPTPTTDQLRIRALFEKIESGNMTQSEIIETLKFVLVRKLRHDS